MTNYYEKVLVALYLRLSEEDRKKLNKNDLSESIQNQRTMLLEYADAQEWLVYDIYIDEDYAGADRNRPEWNRLLKDAEEKKFQVVLCKTQSRFTREMEMVEKYINFLFPLWGIRFISITDHADTEVEGNKKSRQINGLMNEWYLEDLSKNIKSVLKSKSKNGFHIGSFALYGYMKDPNKKGHLIIDEEAAEVVREVFRMFLAGKGKMAIARELNSRGIPNPTEYKRQHGLRYMQAKNKNSTLWKYFAISDMLGNEMYIGNMVQHRYENPSYKIRKSRPVKKEDWIIVENTHDPIIDMDTWNKVKEIRESKARPMCTGDLGLFASKVRCMYCGYNLRNKKTGGYRYLACSTREVHKEACIGSMISVHVLEKVVLEELKKLSIEYLNNSFIEKNIKLDFDIENRLEKLKNKIIELESKIEHNDKLIKSTYIDKANGIIDADMFLSLTADFKQEIVNSRELITKLNSDISKLQEKSKEKICRKDILEKYKNIESLNRNIVLELIDYIEIGHRIEGTKKRPINIHWNF